MKIDTYPVGKLLGFTEQFRIYQCGLPDGQAGILKIAILPAQNGILDREAYVLRALREEAERCEEEYRKLNPGKVLNYAIQFPNLIDSFVSPDQGDRRINIMIFVNVSDNLSRLVPIEQVIARDRVRVDPRTSAWIMGKILKLLSFAHGQGIAVGNVTPENILLEREQHYVAFFDWSQAILHADGDVPAEVAREEISQATKAVISLLGGNPETGELPLNDQLENDLYGKRLFALAQGEESDSWLAHENFYKLIRNTLGWSGYHPFTTYSLERS